MKQATRDQIIPVRLTKKERRDLKRFAKSHNMTVSETIRKAQEFLIENYRSEEGAK
jgi:hypothetical protein|tara:strand:- start:112 stop:279 length:168 start_codon:yes stop_codon:yes gene_type:complete